MPQFSVNGSDPLSAAIGAGSGQMEARMAALPGIQAKAKTVAGNIGVAGQKYRETDETLAQKASSSSSTRTMREPQNRRADDIGHSRIDGRGLQPVHIKTGWRIG